MSCEQARWRRQNKTRRRDGTAHNKEGLGRTTRSATYLGQLAHVLLHVHKGRLASLENLELLCARAGALELLNVPLDLKPGTAEAHTE